MTGGNVASLGPRGQHPHRRPGGNYDLKARAFVSSGPIHWDDQHEIERIRWDTRFEPEDEPGATGSPFAHGLVKGGMDMDTQAKLRNLEKMGTSGGAASAYQNADLALAQVFDLKTAYSWTHSRPL